MAEEIKKDEEVVEEQTPTEEAPPGEEEKVEEQKQEDEDLQAKFLRLSADFQNFRRRSEAEKADIYAYANEKIVLQILDVIDNSRGSMKKYLYVGFVVLIGICCFARSRNMGICLRLCLLIVNLSDGILTSLRGRE